METDWLAEDVETVEDIYSESYRDALLDDDEITPEECAFMSGYDNA